MNAAEVGDRAAANDRGQVGEGAAEGGGSGSAEEEIAPKIKKYEEQKHEEQKWRFLGHEDTAVRCDILIQFSIVKASS